jgi:hypothetical protein
MVGVWSRVQTREVSMVKLDEIEVLNEEEKKEVARIEETIDGELKKSRGVWEQAMHKDRSERIWSEIMRRYSDAGWVVRIVPSGTIHHIDSFWIEHPKIVKPPGVVRLGQQGS